jgi:hypothetical protein
VYFCGNCGTSFQSGYGTSGSYPDDHYPDSYTDEGRQPYLANAPEPYPDTGHQPDVAAPAPPLLPEPIEGPAEHPVPEDDHASDGGRRGGADRRSTPLLAFTGVLILAVTVASPALLAEDDDAEAAPAEDEQQPASMDPADLPVGQVLLQPVDQVPEGEFFPDAALDVAGGEEAEVDLPEIAVRVASLPDHPTTRDESTASLSGLVVSGTEPGVYSGQRREAVCDRNTLVDLVTDGENADEAVTGQFADALELESPDEIEAHIDTLTAVRLRLDTRVTHHSLIDGTATPIQALLQAGTGVMVDETGVPRISCNGGNPLSAPATAESEPADEETAGIDQLAGNPGAAWDRLDPARVVTIEPGADAVEDVLIADIDSTDLVERPVGTGGGRDMGPGDLVATLTWESPADLDLSVVDPNEATISTERQAPENSKGRLDGDGNKQCEDNMVGQEEISWPDGDAPEGEYALKVTGHAVGDKPAGADDDAEYAMDCGGNSADYTLTVHLYGQDTVVHEGSVGDSESEDYTATVGE